MSLLTKKGTITLPTSVGSVVTTGVGFQPKAVILWTTRQTATGFGANVNLSVGFITSTQQFCSVIRGEDAVAAASATSIRQMNNARALVPQVASGGTAEGLLTLTSLDSDGFTLALTNPSGTLLAVVVHYLALGGTDITNAYVGLMTVPGGTATGNKSYTGVGFKPDLVISCDTTHTDGVGGSYNNANFGVSAFTSTGQGSSQRRSVGSANPTDEENYQRNDKAWAGMTTAGGIDHEATYVSMDTDGFTLNHTTVLNASEVFGVLCLKGGKYWVGSDTQKTSTGTNAKTGVGFIPSAILLFGTNRASSTSTDLTQSKFSIGATDGVNQGSSWLSATDNVATSVAKSSHSTTKVIQHNTNAATIDAEASVSSFDSDGYTLNWTTADATAREFISVSFGSTPASARAGTFDTNLVSKAWF